VNCVPLSVMMEFGTPKRWMIFVKNVTACSDLMLVKGRTSIHLENLSTATSRCVKPPGAFCKGLSGQVRLSCVELTPLAGAYNPSGVGHYGRPVETLLESVSHEGPRRCMVTASPQVYFL
jgi:hypothetical protein